VIRRCEECGYVGRDFDCYKEEFDEGTEVTIEELFDLARSAIRKEKSGA